MLWKITILRFTTNICVLLLFMGGLTQVNAQIQNNQQNQNDLQPQQNPMNPAQNQQPQQPDLQQETPGDSTIAPAQAAPSAPAQPQSPLDTMDTDNFQRYKVDGVTAVVGNYLVLESDIEKFRADIESQMSGNENITDCEMIDHLMENKLFSHAALQDSTVYGQISDEQIEQQIEQQIMQLVEQIGSMKKLLNYYRKDSEDEMREELFKINKENSLAEAMQHSLTEEVEITPEEVREYFDSIPKDDRPNFSDEVEIARIQIDPEIPQAEIDKVVDNLNELRTDIVENGASFSTKAVLYSEDNTSAQGGRMEITRQDPLDKDFKEIAFSLREGEVSKPFKSAFGYHIVKVEKVLGQQREIRHIIMMPKATSATIEKAKEKADSIRTLIENDSISFADAAKKYSDDEVTRSDGGKILNPDTGDRRWELTKVDPRMYNEVNRVKNGGISKPISDQNETGQKFFKIITVTDFYPEHQADYSKDFTKIRELALQQKQMRIVREWREEEIQDTHIKVNGDYKECDFDVNWLKI